MHVNDLLKLAVDNNVIPASPTNLIGLLRAVGLSRRQLKRMLRLESIVIAAQFAARSGNMLLLQSLALLSP